MSKVARCWCKKKLISEVKCEDGSMFPLGFFNCPVHTCWYESKEAFKEHLKNKSKSTKRPVRQRSGYTYY